MTDPHNGLLKGEVAVISGGLGDIGLATARELQGQGAAVAISDLADPEATPEEARGLAYAQVDVTSPEQVEQWVERVAQDHGTPTIAVLNAGIVRPGTVLEGNLEDWNATLNVNLNGCLHLARAVGRRMKEARKGHIVLIGSWAAHAAHPHLAAYSVAKAGLRMLGQCLALELAPFGVRVNEVAPGYVDAGLSAQLFRENPRQAQKARNKVPLGEMMSADDVAFAVAQICHPRNRHMAGAVQLLDGGLSLLRGPADPRKRDE